MSAKGKKPDLSAIATQLCEASSRQRWSSEERPCRLPLPSQKTVVELVDSLQSVLFPRYHGKTQLTEDSVVFHVGSTLDGIRSHLQEQIRRGLCFTCRDEDPKQCSVHQHKDEAITDTFIERLPEIQRMLLTDVQAAYEGDPAATRPEETILCYPGILAITAHRIAHELYGLAVPIIPRMINEYAHSATGVDIHPGARIGESFFIDHGTGVVIGETSIIGKNVRIYQGVTLGGKSFPLDKDGKPIKGIDRHPIVEDDVIIYSGASILGRITIGKGSVIGGNVWLMHSVEPGSRITVSASDQTVK